MFGDDHKDDAVATDKPAEDLAAAVQAMSTNPPSDSPQSSFSPDPMSVPAVDPMATPAPSDTVDVPTTTDTPPDLVPDNPTEPEIADTPATADAVLSPSIAPSATPTAPAADDGGLLDIKQNALDQLKPLVDHLDSVPEEKFDALMMMIRASDDQSLIEPAFETAQKIVDDTKRAEALLDIVNEINYLTSNQQ